MSLTSSAFMPKAWSGFVSHFRQFARHRRAAAEKDGCDVNMYLALGNAIGTLEARDLGQRLAVWHDSMVKHLRKVSLRGRNCDEDCPHVDARLLWAEAVDVFGDEAQKLTFLRTHGALTAMPRVETMMEARV